MLGTGSYGHELETTRGRAHVGVSGGLRVLIVQQRFAAGWASRAELSQPQSAGQVHHPPFPGRQLVHDRQPGPIAQAAEQRHRRRQVHATLIAMRCCDRHQAMIAVPGTDLPPIDRSRRLPRRQVAALSSQDSVRGVYTDTSRTGRGLVARLSRCRRSGPSLMPMPEPEYNGYNRGEPDNDQHPAPQRDTRGGAEEADRKPGPKSAAQTNHAQGSSGDGVITHR